MTLKGFGAKQFVIEQGLISSVNAAVRRVHIYENKKGLSKEEYHRKKDKMREDFAKAIIKAAIKIIHARDDQQTVLISSIKAIVKKLKIHKNIFTEEQPTFGVAQKALNLFLKYLWCLKTPHRPLHCPIDNQILKKINWNKNRGKESAKTWPQFSEGDYKKAINLIHKECENTKSQSIAEWELANFKPSIEFDLKPLLKFLRDC